MRKRSGTTQDERCRHETNAVAYLARREGLGFVVVGHGGCARSVGGPADQARAPRHGGCARDPELPYRATGCRRQSP